jgi:hypothetical protein
MEMNAQCCPPYFFWEKKTNSCLCPNLGWAGSNTDRVLYLGGWLYFWPASKWKLIFLARGDIQSKEPAEHWVLGEFKGIALPAKWARLKFLQCAIACHILQLEHTPGEATDTLSSQITKLNNVFDSDQLLLIHEYQINDG